MDNELRKIAHHSELLQAKHFLSFWHNILTFLKDVLSNHKVDSVEPILNLKLGSLTGDTAFSI